MLLIIASVAQLAEQLTLNQLVPGSSPGRGTKSENMAWVYILRGSSGRHYVGSTTDLNRRIQQHQSGHTHTTRRQGTNLEIIATRKLPTLQEARMLEREMKRKKNPQLALYLLEQRNQSNH